ncbi:unnamed protein product [Strongylus vulgaris]|uniref:Uncharacterized protein n=1 Tax=Strongylus vulgaris TaxID=40348 RepID=A0A3P7J0C6_STRVU|nr:unnamed protein product [Strongylus vulgaris]
MVAIERPRIASALQADGFQTVKPDRLFRRASVIRSCSLSSQHEYRPASRKSVQRALRQASQVCGLVRLHLSLRTVDGSVKYRVNCGFDKLGNNGHEQFFRPHVENER